MQTLLTIAGVILFAVAAFGLAELLERLQRKPFGPAEWLESPRNRRWLVHDLVSGRRLLGQSREAIVALLGPPDYESPASIVYWLTSDRFGDKLRIRIDPNGRVFKAKVEDGC